MSVNRVQKLLFSEYCDFEDMVLIESPFAQTTRDGKGIRQVHLGLTPSKLVLATDVLPPVEYVNVNYNPGIDPDIETFELIAIYPVECVNLSVYRRKKKQALKARFCNNKVLYFELGGFERRAMFWNLWCERVKFLCPGDSGSSRSETSVATSTTGSTLYLLDRKLVSVNGMRQLWCKFGPNYGYDSKFAGSQRSLVKKWTDKNLYLGKNFDMSFDYKPIINKPNLGEFVRGEGRPNLAGNKYPDHPTHLEEKALRIGDIVQVNRFGDGINEGCGNPLYLSVDDYVIPRRYSEILKQQNSDGSTASITNTVNYEQLAESAVLTWEFYKADDPNKYRVKHRRRYGLATQPWFLFSFGPYDTASGAKYSLQMKRAVSEVNITRVRESERRLPVAKKLLAASVSHQHLNSLYTMRTNSILNAPKTPVTLFWTPGYSYRPRSAKVAYESLRKHLSSIGAYLETSQKHKRRKKGRHFFKKRSSGSSQKTKDTDEESTEEPYPKRSRKKKYSFIYNIFSAIKLPELDVPQAHTESSFHCLRKTLEVEVEMTAWDFDSTTLAEQLTMIEKDLFMKIPSAELEAMMWQQHSRNAPNLCACIAFSYRISNLLASEILKSDSERLRARLVARLINVANKCHRISNFQSCKTVMCSLQSPAIYRLKRTWAYLRKKHSSKYQTFEYLCRLYRDPRLSTYQKTFFVVSQNPPFLPYVGDIISKLLSKVPDYNFHSYGRLSRNPSIATTKSTARMSAVMLEDDMKKPSIFSKLFNVFVTGDVPSAEVVKSRRSSVSRRKVSMKRKSVKFKGLYEYFDNFDVYEDCREDNLDETTTFLERCQLGAMNYNFTVNDLAKSYLLKSRYGDDKVSSKENVQELDEMTHEIASSSGALIQYLEKFKKLKKLK